MLLLFPLLELLLLVLLTVELLVDELVLDELLLEFPPELLLELLLEFPLLPELPLEPLLPEFPLDPLLVVPAVLIPTLVPSSLSAAPETVAGGVVGTTGG